MQVRKANIQDLMLLGQLFNDYRQFYKQKSDIDGAVNFMKQRLNSEDSVILVVENNQELLGFTQLYPSFSSVSMQRMWVLNDLYVAQSARRSGVANALMEAARVWAKETDSKGLLLETDLDNHKAQRLYEKLGYIKQDSTYHYFLST